MTLDDFGSIASVGAPAPAFLRMPGWGAAFRGTLAPATVVIREEFTGQEWAALEAGKYIVGAKIYNRDGVVGLVLELSAAGGRLLFFLNYSLRHLAVVHGQGALDAVVESLERFKEEREPGLGLLVLLVFLDLDPEQTVRAVRAFTLPRMFGDRFLLAVERTIDQELEVANHTVATLCGNAATAWSNALPGVAAAGHELEQTEGEYVRIRKQQRKAAR